MSPRAIALVEKADARSPTPVGLGFFQQGLLGEQATQATAAVLEARARCVEAWCGDDETRWLAAEAASLGGLDAVSALYEDAP